MLTDNEIQRMLTVGKKIGGDFRAQVLRMNVVANTAHRRSSRDVKGDDGNEYCVKLRQSTENVLDFSAILVVNVSGKDVILRRYNGKSHEHRNPIERDRFYDFHIHTATHRYFERGCNPEGFAEPTDRYTTIAEAVDCLLSDCGFYYDRSNTPLFPETNE